MEATEPDECCPLFDPVPWNGKVITWKDKTFVKDHVMSLFHVPLNYGAVMTRNIDSLRAADALATPRLILTDEKSQWGADVYFEVTREVPFRPLVTLSGTFLTKVYEGPFSDIRKWIDDMTVYVADQGKTLDKLFFFYTTCPKCAKKYGKNYVVLLARI
ncbi:MAG TPA: hydrolase [Moraxellaceae bacterium]|nr:hydrolase [Moraxellaceae bacterium]